MTLAEHCGDCPAKKTLFENLRVQEELLAEASVQAIKEGFMREEALALALREIRDFASKRRTALEEWIARNNREPDWPGWANEERDRMETIEAKADGALATTPPGVSGRGEAPCCIP